MKKHFVIPGFLLLCAVFVSMPAAFPQKKKREKAKGEKTAKKAEAERAELFGKAQYRPPVKAALLSAVLPGAGQIHNGKRLYIRLPLIYGTLAVLGLTVANNHREYVDARNALIYALDDDENTSPEQVNPVFVNVSTETLLSRRDFFRYNRDLTIIFTVIAHGLNIAEAAVTAHLKGFNVNDDLSLRILPSMQHIRQRQMAPGIKFVFTLR